MLAALQALLDSTAAAKAVLAAATEKLYDAGGFVFDAKYFGIIPTGTKFSNLTLVAASTTVTDPNAGFTPSMTNMMLVLPFGGRITGTAMHGGCGPTFTYVSPTQGTLSFAPAYSVTGAEGYMVPDNNTAINNAWSTVSAANNGRGGIIRFSSGIYGIGQLVEQSNVTVIGAGFDRTIFVDRGITSKLFWTPGEQAGGIGRVSNFSVLDIGFEGSRVNFVAPGPSRVDGGLWRISSRHMCDAFMLQFCKRIVFDVVLRETRSTVVLSGSWQRDNGRGLYLQGSQYCHGVAQLDLIEGMGCGLDAGHAVAGNAQTTAVAVVGNEISVSGADVSRMAGTRLAEDGVTLAAMNSAVGGVALEGAQHNKIRGNLDRIGSALLVSGGETAGTCSAVLVSSDQSGSLNINTQNDVLLVARDIDGAAVIDQAGQQNAIRVIARNICRGGISYATSVSPSSGADATNNPGALNYDTLDDDIEIDIQQDSGVGASYANPLNLNGGAAAQVVKRVRVHGRLGPYSGALMAFGGTAANRPTSGADRNWVEPIRGDMAKFTTVTPVGAGSIAQTDADPVLLVDATNGAQTVTWPTAVGRDGMCLTTVKIDASGNAVTVDPSGAQTVNGAATVALAARWDRIKAMSDGTNWVRVD